MQKNPQVSASIQNMFAQSTAVLAQPSVATFERFEKRGTTQQAYIYVLLAALVSGLIAGFFALFRSDVNFIGQFLTPLIIIPLGFAVFTGAVYSIGKALFKGTGTYPEVAYTFALFYVPLSIVGTVIGIIPILGWLVGVLIALVMVFFGFLAVQSSMNIRTNGEALGLLVLSGLAFFVVRAIVTSILVGLFVVGSMVTGN
jgi:Yip1 domain